MNRWGDNINTEVYGVPYRYTAYNYCYYSAYAASLCETVPGDSSHRRLCACRAGAAVPPSAPQPPPPYNPGTAPPPSDDEAEGMSTLLLTLGIGGGVLFCCLLCGLIALAVYCLRRPGVADYRRAAARDDAATTANT